MTCGSSPITPKSSPTISKATYSTPSANAAPSSTVYYSSAYSLVPPPRLYSRPNSVLNSTYKSNFNPATTNNNLYNHHTSRLHHHHHHHPICIDYASDELDLDDLTGKKAYTRIHIDDDHDYYSSAYSYSKIY